MGKKKKKKIPPVNLRKKKVKGPQETK